jgi:hypothetical protein
MMNIFIKFILYYQLTQGLSYIDNYRHGHGYRTGDHEHGHSCHSHRWHERDRLYSLCPYYQRPNPPVTIEPEPAPVNDGCGGYAGKKVYIVADNGLYLARCNNCGPGSSADSVTVHGSTGQAFAQWTLSSVDGKCALKSDTGKYAGRCNGCWRGGKYPDSVFNHVTSPNGVSYALWTVESVNGKFTFKADTGKYMARCNGCVPGLAKDNSAMVHATSPESYAQWSIVPV